MVADAGLFRGSCRVTLMIAKVEVGWPSVSSSMVGPIPIIPGKYQAPKLTFGWLVHISGEMTHSKRFTDIELPTGTSTPPSNPPGGRMSLLGCASGPLPRRAADNRTPRTTGTDFRGAIAR